MHLSELMRPTMVWSELDAKTKSEVISELARNMATSDESLDAQLIAHILMERERLGSTGIQEGIAIPHGKVPGLQQIIIACGRSSPGIDFDAHDQKPTHLFFVLLAPESAAGNHLKALARLSRLLKDESCRTELLRAQNASEMYDIIIREDGRI